LNLQTNWQPPENWRKITMIDAQTGGETILERRRFARENFDNLRKALMFEPRGHADMYSCILTPPVSPDADIGVLFTHNEGYSTMCGHGIIGLTKVLLDAEIFPKIEPETTLKIDTPAGLVTARARVVNNLVASVYFHNVPSFVVALGAEW
jgi:trans-L-3-hydroxyproline dehydratase